MYFVYVLKSLRTGIYYKGLTENVERRVKEHVLGKSPTTKNKLPLALIHVEICNTRMEARTIEKYFKSGYGREMIHQIDKES